MIRLNVYGVSIGVDTNDSVLDDFICAYYQAFVVSEGVDKYDIVIDIKKYSYFTSRQKIQLDQSFRHIGDYVQIDLEGKKYFFQNNEITALLDFSSETIRVTGLFQPLILRHWLNILLQGFERIRKYYDRFIIKTLLHDVVFLILERRLGTNILHATAVTDEKRTYIFTGLGGSGKSTLASAFLTQKGFKILSDNYCIVKDSVILPFPELPRITLETSQLLGLKKGKKADGIKTYLKNPLENLKESYPIDAVFICSYGNTFSTTHMDDEMYIYELITSINNYTKEFPEYLNLALLSFLGQYNTNNHRQETLKTFIHENKFFILQNDVHLIDNIEKILHASV